jgi:hypothetical protein
MCIRPCIPLHQFSSSPSPTSNFLYRSPSASIMKILTPLLYTLPLALCSPINDQSPTTSTRSATAHTPFWSKATCPPYHLDCRRCPADIRCPPHTSLALLSEPTSTRKPSATSSSSPSLSRSSSSSPSPTSTPIPKRPKPKTYAHWFPDPGEPAALAGAQLYPPDFDTDSDTDTESAIGEQTNASN